MKLSVIIPCYNAAQTIAIQLTSLANQEWSEPWEIIVAENGSTDESQKIIQQFQNCMSNLSMIDASAKRGQPYALNEGARAAKGESLAFCDADDETGPGWVRAIGEALTQYDFVACRWETQRLNSAWAQHWRRNPQADKLQRIWYPPYLSHAGGGSIGVKRKLYESVGTFDESLPILHDTDFCFKLQMAGVKLHFVPDAVIHVRFRDSLLGSYRQSRDYAEYNVLLSKRYRETKGDLSTLQRWRDYLRGWKGLLCAVPGIRENITRFQWMQFYGRQIGRLRGTLKYWTPPV